MIGYACVLIALIDNLDEVYWNYTAEKDSALTAADNRPAEADDNRTASKGSVTSEQCSQWVEEDIKGFSESPDDVQRLLDKLTQIQFRR